MRKIERGDRPEILKNWEEWGQEYKVKKEVSPGHSFNWKQVSKKKVNQEILPHLIRMSDAHCHYCDGYPPGKADDTIDHFKPKGDTRFYHLVYQWENLYLACADCQKSKGENYNDDLLRPDDTDYSFGRYFTFNYYTNEVEINPGLQPTDADYIKAETTIRIFGFNEGNNPIKRRHAIERYRGIENPELLDFPFRFIFE